MALVVEKKTIIGAKVSKEEKERIAGRCSGLKCSTSDYIKKLIDRDLAWPTEGNIARIRFEADRIIIPCSNCGKPVPINLAEAGLRITYR